MMSHKQIPDPPRLFLNFLRWFCKAELLEEIEGDLIEQYQLNAKKKGVFKAKLGFAKEVLLLFRPGIYGEMRKLFSGILNTPALKLESVIGYLFMVSMFIVSREYKDVVLIMFSIFGIYFTLQRLIRKKRQDQENGTHLFEKDLRGIGFRMIFIIGIVVTFYFLVSI